MGYHTKKIKKGILGEFSKIQEEFNELEDAFEQDDVVLQICELSDILGAIESYLEKFNLKIEDLKKFSDKTKSSFQNGERTSIGFISKEDREYNLEKINKYKPLEFEKEIIYKPKK